MKFKSKPAINTAFQRKKAAARGKSIKQASTLTLHGEINFPVGKPPFASIIYQHGCKINDKVTTAWTKLLVS